VAKFVLRRLLAAIPVLVGGSIVVFLMLKLVPGDAARTILGQAASEERVQALREVLGLNRPIYEQYFRWLWQYLTGQWGMSLVYTTPIKDLLFTRFLNTLILTAGSLVLVLAVAIPVGLISGTRRFSFFDRSSMLFALIGASLPQFWLGLMLILVFSLRLGWFPATGMYSMRGDQGLVDLLHHLVLPAITTAAVSAAVVTRLLRSAAVDIIHQEYIKALRAKGFTDRVVNFQFVLRSALIPLVNITGLQIGYLLGGAVFSEVIFNWPGMGHLLYVSILNRDVPVVQASVLLVTFCFVLVNMLADVTEVWLNPRAQG
jgi:peptide/nickel transport system permease protein